MVSHHPGKFGGHGHCGSGDMFLVNEQEDSRCSRFSSPLLFISIGHGLKAHIIMTMTPILVTRAYAAITETFENNLFHSVPKGCGEKEKRKWQLQSFLRYK